MILYKSNQFKEALLETYFEDKFSKLFTSYNLFKEEFNNISRKEITESNFNNYQIALQGLKAKIKDVSQLLGYTIESSHSIQTKDYSHLETKFDVSEYTEILSKIDNLLICFKERIESLQKYGFNDNDAVFALSELKNAYAKLNKLGLNNGLLTCSTKKAA